MLLVRYLINYLPFIFIFSSVQSSVAAVVKEQCGQYIFQIKISHASVLYERQYALYYQSKTQEKKLFYKTEAESGDWLDAACVKNAKNRSLMLFRTSCSGNACPENIFGIFDPESNQMILKPSDWPKGNDKEVEKIIGYPILLTNNNENFFCCRQ